MKKQPVTFESFLCGVPARDYVNQKMPYEEQIARAAEMIHGAEFVLLGAGAGMSTAAGAVYGGDWFKENFGEFQQKYGDGPYMQDMYSAGFYPYPTEEAYWGYWSKQCLKAGVELDVTPLHRLLLDTVKGRDLFCLSTNADAQFTKAGLPEEQIFCTQGDYFHIQCARACHPKSYDAAELFRQMDAARKDCLIPSALVPKCPVCGGRMVMNLRADGYFVQDEAWYKAEKRFGDYLTRALGSRRRMCLIELGVGFNTPAIIRFPFEKLVRENRQVTLIRLNLNMAAVPASFGDRAVGISGDMAKTIRDISEKVLSTV